MKKYKKVYIEITNICNLSCSFCPKTKRALKSMKTDEFEYIISKVESLTDHVYFHLMGEPLLNPNLSDFLKICECKKMNANITTNGTLIENLADVLLNSSAVRKISFSLHSFEANEKAGLEEYLRKITEFCKLASGKGIICELRLWNSDNGEIAGQNNLNGDIIRFVVEKLADEKYVEGENTICQNVFWGHANKFEWHDSGEEEIEFCLGLRDHFGILVDGTVVPCCLDNDGEMALGNVFTEELSDILENDRAKRIYNGFSDRKAVEDRCKECGYARRFGGK